MLHSPKFTTGTGLSVAARGWNEIPKGRPVLSKTSFEAGQVSKVQRTNLLSGAHSGLGSGGEFAEIALVGLALGCPTGC